MVDRRLYERLYYPFPIRLETISNGKQVLNLKTINISASGTFISTPTFFPEGTRFVLELTFPINHLTDKYVETLNGCKGSLIRSTPHGIAIQFDRHCQMECLKIL